MRPLGREVREEMKKEGKEDNEREGEAVTLRTKL